MDTEFTIDGYVVGESWMPGRECYKPLRLTFVRRRDNGRRDWVPAFDTLRDAALAATNDGDFCSCKIADGHLVITRVTRSQYSTVTRERAFELARFPSIGDMLKPDWDGPAGYEDDEPLLAKAARYEEAVYHNSED